MTVYELLPTFKGKYKPHDISYTKNHILIGTNCFCSGNPRYDYAYIMTTLFDPVDPEINIGTSTFIHPTATIGGKGFGFVFYGVDNKIFPPVIEMPHFGGVSIGENCYIGERVNIHRGVIHNTIIRDWNKIDYGVHIAHNVMIDECNTIAALTSIEGSVKIGSGNIFGSNVTIQRKVTVGSHCIFGSGTVVTKDVEDYSVIVGNPGRLLRKL